ncbi:MAG: hypothetical protein IPP55_16910 [Anaerolineales bacterium]|nr:hypothetical protein [Anaerolineales bacterium]
MNSLEIKEQILEELEKIPITAGITDKIYSQLILAGNEFSKNLALELLASENENKRSKGMQIARIVDGENNLNLAIPLLQDNNHLIRWQAMQYITETNKFLEDIDIIKIVIYQLLNNTSPVVRIEAAASLEYCKIIPDAIPALEYVRDHDHEEEDGFSVSYIASRVLKDLAKRTNDNISYRWKPDGTLEAIKNK